MRPRARFALVLLLAAPAAAQEAPAAPPATPETPPPADAPPPGIVENLTPPPPPPPEKKKKDLSHRLQGGVGVTAGSGYRVGFKYSDAGTCGAAGKNTCTGLAPAWLDVKLFFGAARALDIVLEHRFGLQKDFSATSQFIAMLGVRVYPAGATEMFKFFLQPQLVIDYTDPGTTGNNRLDVGIRFAPGFQVDPIRWIGLYAQVSAMFMFVRYFTFQFDFGGGVEFRFP